MSRTKRKTHYKNGEPNQAQLRCKLKGTSNKLKKGHTKQNCWGCH